MKLYGYWRSTAAYRVRIALALKGIEVEQISVDLTRGAQNDPAYTALNPAHVVPTLVTDEGQPLTQSLAIIDWLEATHPEPPLLPAEPLARARVLAAAHVVAMDIHPVNNLRVVTRLTEQFGATMEDRIAWMHHWMRLGFDALEAMLAPETPFAFGDAPGLADICLVAQCYNAHRWGLDLAPWPRIAEVEARCLALEPFARARPEAQPDAPNAPEGAANAT